MIELRRIILVDWYLFRAQQVDMRGMAAIIGPNGAGKSAIIDAVQTVLSGASMASIRFNPSAQSNVRSKRTLRDYCLGVVSLDEKGERSEPTRQHAYTYIILVFEDLKDGSAVSLGVAFSASASRSDESCEARFIAKGALTKDDILAAVGDDEVETLQWHAVRNALRARNIEVDDAFSSATDFVAESLRALSPAGFPLDPRRFQKAFRNALLLKPVDNPTDFVRNYVLDVQPLQVDRLRRGIEHWRSLTRRIEELRAQSASLAGILRIVGRAVENERVIATTGWLIARLEWEKFCREARRQEEALAQFRSAAGKAEVEATAAAARHATLDAEHKTVELSIRTSDAEQLAQMYESDKTATLSQRANAMAPVKDIDGLIASIKKAVELNLLVRRNSKPFITPTAKCPPGFTRHFWLRHPWENTTTPTSRGRARMARLIVVLIRLRSINRLNITGVFSMEERGRSKFDNAMLSHTRFSLNMKRVASLTSLALSNEGELKPANGFHYEGVSADLFRMIVVFLHATVEDLVRSQLPERTKFTFSSGADIDKALRKAGFNPEPLKEMYPPLNMMARRRIAIVHHADFPPDAENVEAWNTADVWCLIQWNLAVIAFLYQLLSVVTEPADLYKRRYAAAKQAMHEHIGFGNMIRDLPNALRTAVATSDTTKANNLLSAMQDKLTTVQKLISFKEEAQ